MTGKGPFNQTGGTHPFSSSSNLCFVAYKLFIVSIQCSSFLSFLLCLVYLLPTHPKPLYLHGLLLILLIPKAFH